MEMLASSESIAERSARLLRLFDLTRRHLRSVL